MPGVALLIDETGYKCRSNLRARTLLAPNYESKSMSRDFLSMYNLGIATPRVHLLQNGKEKCDKLTGRSSINMLI